MVIAPPVPVEPVLDGREAVWLVDNLEFELEPALDVAVAMLELPLLTLVDAEPGVGVIGKIVTLPVKV